MMEGCKVVSALEMSHVEGLAYAEGFLQETFMENAGISIADKVETFTRAHSLPKIVTLLVGKGNNGGDAYVAGTKLLQKGFSVRAWHIYSLEQCGPLCQKQHERFSHAGGSVSFVHREQEIVFPKEGVLLDGLVGTGFRGKAEGPLAETIQQANLSGLPILSIDIPSGLCGNTGKVGSVAIHARQTLFLELPKIGFFLEEGWNYVGELIKAEFGLPPQFLDKARAEAFLLSNSVASSLPPIRRNRHKYQAGYALFVAGSDLMPGAALLSSYSALKAGAGIVRLFYPMGLETELSSAPWELIKEPWDMCRAKRIFEEQKRAHAICLGPGLGREKAVKKMLHKIMPYITLPTVLDADALFFLAENPSLPLPNKVLLTPHKGEMHRLLSTRPFLEEEHLLSRCQSYCNEKNCTLIVKGGPSFVFHPFTPPLIVPVGSPGMATAGSGDVLSGVATALLAGGSPLREAAALAAFIHGRAGELAAKSCSSYSMTAQDIMEHLAKVFLAVEEKTASYPCSKF